MSHTSHAMDSTPETTKTGKRKGTRSVSTLTPSQLARKRANDREAQRAIRARTKEHIENLEREIEELRSQQSRDQTIQALLRRNKALEDELHQLRKSAGIHVADASERYQPALHTSSPTRPHSFGQSTPNYPMVQNMAYSSISDAAESWPAGIPCSLPSTASSPTSSVGTDDFSGSNYIPTSAPSTVFEPSSLPPQTRSPTISCVSGESAFDEVKSDFGCSQLSIVPMNPAYNFQPWNTYPMQQYHPPPTAAALNHSAPQIPQIARCTF